MKLGLCGLGTVASSLVKLLAHNSAEINRHLVEPVELVHLGARRDNPGCDTSQLHVSRDIFAVAEDPAVEVLVELIGGTDVARELLLRAIANGKHIVTANKALLAEHGNEIFEAAREKNVQVRFDAAVAGGIPVIRALTEGLAGNRIQQIAGIINGTGNFILTEMSDNGRDYASALADAQALGYAEADPTFDVEGIDAAQKLSILAALAYDIPFNADPCFTEGISRVAVQDIHYARELGYRIKHLGMAELTPEGIALRVHPALVAEDHLLSQVDDVMNAVYIRGDAVGSTLYYGPGAGGDATASAVLSDVISLARGHRVNYLSDSVAKNKTAFVGIEDTRSAFYLRIDVTNKAGVLSQITRCLGEQDISVEALHQSGPHEHRSTHSPKGRATAPVVLTTSVVVERDLVKAVRAIEALDLVVGEITTIRIAELDAI